jgi:hypothetical protein
VKKDKLSRRNVPGYETGAHPDSLAVSSLADVKKLASDLLAKWMAIFKEGQAGEQGGHFNLVGVLRYTHEWALYDSCSANVMTVCMHSVYNDVQRNL